jgi:hypothetical protein
MALAQTDWHRYQKNNLPNVWDYSKNEKVLQEFWKSGLERSKNWEKLVTVGMRGDGDEAMGEGTNISLLKIVKDQRKIIADVTGKKRRKHLRSGLCIKKFRIIMTKECGFRMM